MRGTFGRYVTIRGGNRNSNYSGRLKWRRVTTGEHILIVPSIIKVTFCIWFLIGNACLKISLLRDEHYNRSLFLMKLRSLLHTPQYNQAIFNIASDLGARNFKGVMSTSYRVCLGTWDARWVWKGQAVNEGDKTGAATNIVCRTLYICNVLQIIRNSVIKGLQQQYHTLSLAGVKWWSNKSCRNVRRQIHLHPWGWFSKYIILLSTIHPLFTASQLKMIPRIYSYQQEHCRVRRRWPQLSVTSLTGIRMH